PPTDPRQGRALPADAQARMGSRPDISLLRASRRSAVTLAASLQRAAAPLSDREPTTHQPRSEPPWAGHLEGQLTCYARAVISDEWPAMRHRRESKLVQGWLAALDTSIGRLDIKGQKQTVAYAHW